MLVTAAGRAKLSDMGLSKLLGTGESSFESHGTGQGTAGWQACLLLRVYCLWFRV